MSLLAIIGHLFKIRLFKLDLMSKNIFLWVKNIILADYKSLEDQNNNVLS